MPRFTHPLAPIIRRTLLLLLWLGCTWAVAHGAVLVVHQADSVRVNTVPWSEMPKGRMVQSAHPVKLSVKGASLLVTSKHEQMLPIYTEGGSLYLYMQLSPGANWLNGLPAGRYRINNRVVEIR